MELVSKYCNDLVNSIKESRHRLCGTTRLVKTDTRVAVVTKEAK